MYMCIDLHRGIVSVALLMIPSVQYTKSNSSYTKSLYRTGQKASKQTISKLNIFFFFFTTSR